MLLHQLDLPAQRISALATVSLFEANWSLMARTGGGFIRCRWPMRFSMTRAWPQASMVFTLRILRVEAVVSLVADRHHRR